MFEIFVPVPKIDPKRLHPTGDGNEKWYHDDAGFIRHIPPRTKFSHPYSYDPIVCFDSGKSEEPGTTAVYTDRMVQWDYDKFRKCMDALNNGKGEMMFNWSSKSKVEALVRMYYDNKKIKVSKVIETCNVSNGFPTWVIYYSDK